MEDAVDIVRSPLNGHDQRTFPVFDCRRSVEVGRVLAVVVHVPEREVAGTFLYGPFFRVAGCGLAAHAVFPDTREFPLSLFRGLRVGAYFQRGSGLIFVRVNHEVLFLRLIGTSRVSVFPFGGSLSDFSLFFFRFDVNLSVVTELRSRPWGGREYRRCAWFLRSGFYCFQTGLVGGPLAFVLFMYGCAGVAVFLPRTIPHASPGPIWASQ